MNDTAVFLCAVFMALLSVFFFCACHLASEFDRCLNLQLRQWLDEQDRNKEDKT